MGSEHLKRPRAPKAIGRVAFGVAMLLVGGGAGWAVHTVLLPPADALVESSSTTITTATGVLESALSLNVTVNRPLNKQGTNQATGTVTSLADVSAPISSGQVLYSVDLRPTVAAVGTVPSFRALKQGDSGVDVKQLNNMLKDLSLLQGQAGDAFTAATAAAVSQWQTNLSRPAEGTVQAGDILYLPVLPAQLAFDSDIAYPGAPLSGGERFVSVADPIPTFSIVVTQTQNASIPDGAQVEINHASGSWIAVVGERATTSTAENPSDDLRLALDSTDDIPVCKTECANLPNGTSSLPGRIVTQPETQGIIVPTAALKSIDDSTAALVDSDGKIHPVTVEATSQGKSIVDGVPSGVDVRVPYDDSEAGK